MDDFEAAAEEWGNVIEVFPTFTKGGIISENIFSLIPSSKIPNQITVLKLFNLNNQYGSYSIVMIYLVKMEYVWMKCVALKK